MLEKMGLCLLAWYLLFALSGCATPPSPQVRLNTLVEESKIFGFETMQINTQKFKLFGLSPKLVSCENLRIYIEGDGFAWRNRHQPSDNPTPINPVAFHLMAQDSLTCKLYVARPCQYVQDSRCEVDTWTSGRFSEEVLTSFNEALDVLKDRHSIKTFELVGYSGGGAAVALLGAHRNDIKALVSVAGNLDTHAWVTYHKISPLANSFNPASFWKELTKLPQYHLVSTKDKVVPPLVLDAYIQRFEDTKNIHTIIVEDATHQEGWQKYLHKILTSLGDKE